MEDDIRAAYLERLGLEAEPPSIDALKRLHRRHVERVPYETMWIHAGEQWGIDPADSAARIALHGRGGYCYHLNGAFSALLRSLGYEVTRHVGGVHGPLGPDLEALGNHLVLTVSGLPSPAEGNWSGIWYVDVGLGDALHEPLPLAAGTYDEGPFRLVLEETDDGYGDWHLVHDPAGGFTGMNWRSAAAEMEEFAKTHVWLSTAEESGFVRVVTAQRRDATGTDKLQGLMLRRVGDRAVADPEPLTDRDEWFSVLVDVFGLGLDRMAPQVRDRLWQRVGEQHRAWEAAGRPD
jgi:N-hydroxyarylamine O-acetyltransferase